MVAEVKFDRRKARRGHASRAGRERPIDCLRRLNGNAWLGPERPLAAFGLHERLHLEPWYFEPVRSPCPQPGDH